MTDDKIWMKLAIEEAAKATGLTSPNPLVGAVIIKNHQLIGRGHHMKAGTAHAEVNALKNCVESPEGATCYVTLEPCSTHGRTPPCTQALINAKVARVVIGTLDPNPEHAGDAVKILKDAGIEVSYNVLAQECWQLNMAFFKWISTNKPMVTLKMAMTLDGKIATESGQSQWITGSESRFEVQQLRKWADAIIVGGETVRQDNPSLTVRDIAQWPSQPQRYIWSSKNDFCSSLKVFNKDGKEAEIISPKSKEDWHKELTEMGEQHITSLLVEGGGELAANVLECGIVDKIEFFIAPKILGGRDSRPVVGGMNPLNLDEAHLLQDKTVRQLGDDILISGYLSDVHKIK